MTLGDVVSGIGTSGNLLDFQPAAGVECCITWLIDMNNGHSLYGSATTVSTQIMVDSSSVMYAPKIAMWINNTNYLRIYATVASVKGYSGRQTK